MIVLYEYHRQSCGAQHPEIVGLAEKSALIAMNSRDDELDFGQLQRLYFQMRFLMPGLDAAPSNNLAPVSIGGKARREDDPLSIDRICRTKATLLSIVRLQRQRASAGTSPAELVLLTAVILRGLHEGSSTPLAIASRGSAVSKARNEVVGTRK